MAERTGSDINLPRGQGSPPYPIENILREGAAWVGEKGEGGEKAPFERLVLDGSASWGQCQFSALSMNCFFCRVSSS